MPKKKESIKTWKTAKTSKKFNKYVKRAAVTALDVGTFGASKDLRLRYKKSKMQKRDKDECKKSGGVWVKGSCKAKSKFKPGATVIDPISKR